MSPAVSVVIPTYNRAGTIGRALASVAAQDFDGEVEVVVVDNASTDDTAEVVAAYSADVHPVVYRRWEANLGPVENWRRGIELATSDWVKIVWSDDWLLPVALRRLLVTAEQTGSSVVSARARLEVPGQQAIELFHDSAIELTPTAVARGTLHLGPVLPVSPATGLVRRRAALDGLGAVAFEAVCREKAIGPDLALYYWAVFAGERGTHLPEVLSVLVGSPDSITVTSNQRLLKTCYAGSVLRLAEATGAELPADVRVEARHQCSLGRRAGLPADAVHPEAKLSSRRLTRSVYRRVSAGVADRLPSRTGERS